MFEQQLQLRPQELLEYSKKHPHTHCISTQAFSLNQMDYVVHNLSMKGDPTNEFDINNYRRGLAYLQSIIDFKQQNLRVAKKGLKKFFDLIPQFFEMKTSHTSFGRHFVNIKTKMINSLAVSSEFYRIYTTQKANGENAQISWDHQSQLWVIGSKNKTLLLGELNDTKYLINKHQHTRTISIANQWFKMLQSCSEKKQKVKQWLSKYTLIGQICDTEKSGHIVNYGNEVKLAFYALVDKDSSEHSCESPSLFLQFMQEVNFQAHSVKIQQQQVNTFEALMSELKLILVKISESSLEESGEGVVLYITSLSKADDNSCENVIHVCKIKTLEYRIFRKLREKLKMYFQKYRKSYDKMLKNYVQQIRQLCKGFKLPRPQDYYIQIAKKAFDFCQSQQKPISKFFHNKFIGFLSLVRNPQISKQAFKKIVFQDLSNVQIVNKAVKDQSPGNQAQQKYSQGEKINEQKIAQVDGKKQVLVCVPLTIPATGKSTLFALLQNQLPQYSIEILSSDNIRAGKMSELMKKQKNITKKQAYQKTRQSANTQFYNELKQMLRKMEQNKHQSNFVILIDKNHPSNALNPLLEELNKAKSKHPGLGVKLCCILPKCQSYLENKPHYLYPFSASYIACCLKRVLGRKQHETLEGSDIERANVCINFANMFRNFKLSEYNLAKYFQGVLVMPFTKQQPVPAELHELMVKVLLSNKPGTFDEHPALEALVGAVLNWQNQEINSKEHLEQIAGQIRWLFDHFHEMQVRSPLSDNPAQK